MHMGSQGGRGVEEEKQSMHFGFENSSDDLVESRDSFWRTQRNGYTLSPLGNMLNCDLNQY